MEQKILVKENWKAELEKILSAKNAERILLVCSKSFKRQHMYSEIMGKLADYTVTEFIDFLPNPTYDSVVRGIEVFKHARCNFIIAAGGGSCMDVAKCIKLFANMEDGIHYLEQPIVKNKIPILAIPTTAGSGSEATQFAVIYYKGAKQSISHKSCVPEYVIFEPSLLETLPEYQKKSTLFDALCHAIESYWSVNSTSESKEYSQKALHLIMKYKDAYLSNDKEADENMLYAANLAGKSINIAKTTAGHAMSYKLTSLYQITHGHAVMSVLPVLWEFMLKHMEQCVDKRGVKYVEKIFKEISICMGCQNPIEAIKMLKIMMCELDMEYPVMKNSDDMEILCKSVNTERLKNNPVLLNVQDIETIYREIVRENNSYESTNFGGCNKS